MECTVTFNLLAHALDNLANAKIPEIQGFRCQVNHHLELLRKCPKRFSILENRTKQYYAHCQLKLLQHGFTFDTKMDPLIHLRKRLIHFGEHEKKLDVTSRRAVETLENKIISIVLRCKQTREIIKNGKRSTV